jgi:hypothetical protein
MILVSQPDQKTPSRIYRSGGVPDIQNLAEELESVSPHFVLFLAMDATNVPSSSILHAARQLIDRGLACLCVWGPDCSRVHDCFDEERAEDEAADTVVMTTWHDDEPIDEALWYFRNNAWPSDAFKLTCTDWIAISVDNASWERQIREELFERNEGFPP